MAQCKLTLYPYVTLDDKGNFYFANAYSWKMEVTVEDGKIRVPLEPIEISFEYPDDLRPQALAILRAHRTKLNGEHQQTLTKLQFLENNLLALAAPDVLDSFTSLETHVDGDYRLRDVNIEGTATGRLGSDDHQADDILDDDIPF